MDFDAFNRSVGRTIGGHSESFNEKSQPLPPETGSPKDGEPTTTPHWLFLVSLAIGVAIPIGFAVAIWLSQ